MCRSVFQILAFLIIMVPLEGLSAAWQSSSPEDNSTISLTLSDAVYLGLRDNRNIRSAYLNRIAQKFDLYVAEDRFTPKLVISGNYLVQQNQDNRSGQTTLTPTTTLLTPYGTRMSLGWTYQNTDAKSGNGTQSDGANFTVIQPLLRGAGKDIATAPVHLAQLTEQVNRLNLKTSISRTITQIIRAYRDLLLAQEQLKIAQNSLVRAKKLIEINRTMIAAGRMAEFDIVQTEADEASQELAQEEALNRLDIARLALLQLLAVDLHSPVVATESLNAHRVVIRADEAFQQAKNSQPEYLAQLIQGDQATINLAVARNQRLWDVSLVGGAAQQNNRINGGANAHTWDNYVGIAVEVPIGELNTRQAEVQARVNVKNQQLQVEEFRQKLERDVTNAVRDIDTRWRQFEISQRARDLSRRKLEIEREKLTLGRSSNFQVLSYENDLRNAENTRLNALIAYLNAQADLDQILGTTLQSWDITLND